MSELVTVSQIIYYPIKGTAGTSVTSAEIGPRGILYDRELMVVDHDGIFVTQRENPKLATIRPTLEDGILTVSAPGVEPLQINVSDVGLRRESQVWEDKVIAVDQGDQIATWLTDVLGEEYRLVKLPSDARRGVDPTYVNDPEAQVSFADGFPFLLISEASLGDLNTRLETPLPMNRFRPNFVTQGNTSYEEDRWRKIRINGIVYDIVKPCGRCVVTTTDQDTGIVQPKEPLRTLSKYRRAQNGNVMFGQNVMHEGTGVINVGDEVELLEVADTPNFEVRKTH